MFAENRPLLSVVPGHYKCLTQLMGVAAHLKHSAQPPTMEQSFILTLYLLVFTASTAVIKGLLRNLQGVFEVEAFLLTCDSMRCSKEF
jgi:hypothetical protein